MARTLSNKTDFRVVVYPRGLGDFGSISTSANFIYGHGPEAEKRIERDMQARCDDMVGEIKRHVDQVGHVAVEFDQSHVCEHCGSAWTEDSTAYNGGCCSKDEDAMTAAQGQDGREG